MFYVVEKTYAPDGTQLDSDTVGEYATEAEANARIAALTEMYGSPAPGENVSRWFVEAA